MEKIKNYSIQFKETEWKKIIELKKITKAKDYATVIRAAVNEYYKVQNFFSKEPDIYNTDGTLKEGVE